jgi:pimeloyl-ACP methyl ester carboxylesterase
MRPSSPRCRTKATPYWRRTSELPSSSGCGIKPTSSQLTAGACWTSLPFLGLIRQPTLILSADDDPIIPLVNARLMARLIRHSELHVYPGGHVELVTEAPTLTPVITKFLSS